RSSMTSTSVVMCTEKGGPIWIERSKRSNWPPTVSAFHDSCRAMGFADSPDFNDPESTGVGPCARNVRERIHVSTAVGFLAPARNRLNLTIRGGCLAKRVVIENGRALGSRAFVAAVARRECTHNPLTWALTPDPKPEKYARP